MAKAGTGSILLLRAVSALINTTTFVVQPKSITIMCMCEWGVCIWVREVVLNGGYYILV
jgi:hypothetical protein